MSALPSFSRAAVIRTFGAPIRIEEVPIPAEIEPGAILTRIEMCSICGTDVHLWQGSLATKIELPVILGHEMVGRIVALGRGNTGTPLDKHCESAIASRGHTRPAAHAFSAL